MINWFKHNPVAGNLLLLSCILLGVLSIKNYTVFTPLPEVSSHQIVVHTKYRGGSVSLIRNRISIPIENAIYNLDGVQHVYSTSSDEASVVRVLIDDKFSQTQLLNNIKRQVDTLNTLPRNADSPLFSIDSNASAQAIIAVTSTQKDANLWQDAQKVRQQLLALPQIKQVRNITPAKTELSIEVSEYYLTQYNITLAEIAQRIRQATVDISAGNIRTRSGDILIRTNGQVYTAEQFGRLPIIKTAKGRAVRLDQIATIRTQQDRLHAVSHFDGKKAITLGVYRNTDQSSVPITQALRTFVANYHNNAIDLVLYADKTQRFAQQLTQLHYQLGLGLILLLLWLVYCFAVRQALWLVLCSIASICFTFAALTVLNINANSVVILCVLAFVPLIIEVGVRVYYVANYATNDLAHLSKNLAFALIGTALFLLLLSPLGVKAISASIVPVTVFMLLAIWVLSFSILPAKSIISGSLAQQKTADSWLKKHYSSWIAASLRYSTWLCALCISALLIIIFAVLFRVIDIKTLPTDVYSNISVSVSFNSHITLTERKTRLRKIKSQIQQNWGQYIKHTYTTLENQRHAPHSGTIYIETLPESLRKNGRVSADIVNDVQNYSAYVGAAIAAKTVDSKTNPLRIVLQGLDNEHLVKIATTLEQQLAQYPEIKALQNTYRTGKKRISIQLKPKAHYLGFTSAQVLQAIRASVFGVEAQRIQYGAQELFVMVRLAKEKTLSMQQINTLTIPAPKTQKRIAIKDIATIKFDGENHNILQIDRTPSVVIYADTTRLSAAHKQELQHALNTLKTQNPGFNYTLRRASENRLSTSTIISIALMIFGIYAVLSVALNSYYQSVLILLSLPFYTLGAILSALIFGYSISLLTLFSVLPALGIGLIYSLLHLQKPTKDTAMLPSVHSWVLSWLVLLPFLFSANVLFKQLAVQLFFGIGVAHLLNLFILPSLYARVSPAHHGEQDD